jgi:protoporphyrinogen oxidase
MDSEQHITILGAGIAGLSASYHFGHERCTIFERRPRLGGHTSSESLFGFTFDQGPHVSFTKHEYVRDLFERSTDGAIREFSVRTRNYYRGAWIDHPAQVHLWQLPEPLRQRCYEEMISAARAEEAEPPQNYHQWLTATFGATFAETFPVVYTHKYWAVQARDLTTDWLGSRVHRPTCEQIEVGLRPGSTQSLHYITQVRYPERGGFQSFLTELARGVRLRPAKEVAAIDLTARRIWFTDGETHDYERLVSTLPLDEFVSRCRHAPSKVQEAAAALDCSQLLLVNVCAPQRQSIEGHWFYVYDEEKWSTRIHLTERLSPYNVPENHTAIQAEVYFGRQRPFDGEPDKIARAVAAELAEMGFIDEAALARGEAQVFWRWVPRANITFTHPRREALDCIFAWLEQFGLNREEGDLEPTTSWEAAVKPAGSLMFAGRFAQWKYFWTDDCVLRGRQLAGVDR